MTEHDVNPEAGAESATDVASTDGSPRPADETPAQHGQSPDDTAEPGSGEPGLGESEETDSDQADESPETAAGDAPTGRRGARRANLEREGEVAADFLETLLDIADLDGDIDLDIDGDRAAVAIVDSEEGRVPRRLVGPGGKVLEALQELTRLAVQSATGERSRLMLDIAGHRAERRAALVEQAKTAIDEVQSSGQPVNLEPMSAFERKVVHDEVLAAGLVSQSSGTEPRRYVVVHPAGS